MAVVRVFVLAHEQARRGAAEFMRTAPDGLVVTERLPDELPAHHPLMDARQSARQLVACLKAHNDRAELRPAAREE